MRCKLLALHHVNFASKKDMGNIEKLKQERSRYQWNDYATSRTIRDMYPECSRVVLTGKITFCPALENMRKKYIEFSTPMIDCIVTMIA